MQLSGIPKQRRVLIAAALAATTALLVGFHGMTAYLSAVTLGAQAERTAPVAMVPPRIDNQVKPAAPKEVASMPAAPNEVTAVPAREVEMPNPSGIAAAAKAKAQSEMDDLEQASPESPSPNGSRRFRAPKVDLHRVY